MCDQICREQNRCNTWISASTLASQLTGLFIHFFSDAFAQRQYMCYRPSHALYGCYGLRTMHYELMPMKGRLLNFRALGNFILNEWQIEDCSSVPKILVIQLRHFPAMDTSISDSLFLATRWSDQAHVLYCHSDAITRNEALHICLCFDLSNRTCWHSLVHSFHKLLPVQ